MQARKTNCVRIGICVALVFCCPSSLGDELETCVENLTGNGPDFVCVAWEDATAPETPTDFTVSFAPNPFAPDVVLKTGSTSWRVWSIVDEESQDPDVIGSISAIQAENYIVKIANGTDPGATNMGDINLNPSGDHYSALQDGSWITGNLSGTLFVKANAAGGGGFLKLKVDGNVTRNVTAETIDMWVRGDVALASTFTVAEIPAGKRLQIDGDFAGDISITDAIKSGDLTVAGTIASTASITINDIRKTMDPIPEIRLGTSGTDPVEGDLILTSGIKANVLVVLLGALNGAGSVDLTGDNVVGTLDLRNGGSGVVLNGGAVSGTVKLGAWSGDATFSSVAWGKKIEAVTMSGTIEVTGAVTGSIETSGDVSGDITVGGDADAIVVAGTLSGDIDITGDCGTIDVDDGLVSVGRVLVGGEATDGITLGMAICPSALVRVAGGLASTGYIDINPDTSECSVGPLLHGDIEIGNGGNFIFHPDAYILISDGEPTPGGNWSGDIDVIGDFTADPGDEVEICVCGTMSGTITINQPSLTPEFDTPTAACNSHCN